MKTYKHLYPQIASFENLYLAFKAARKGKRSRGDVAEFEFNLEENLLSLQAELRDGTYQPGGYTSFTIHDPKRCLISAAPFRDRVVHHALCNIIEPLFEHKFIFETTWPLAEGLKQAGWKVVYRDSQAIIFERPGHD